MTLMHEGWLNMKNDLMIPASVFSRKRSESKAKC